MNPDIQAVPAEQWPMKIRAISPWFGGKRNLAPLIVKALGKHRVYWEPFCFPSNTPVQTPDGWRPIADLTIGDTILSMSGYLPVGQTMRRRYTGTLVTIKIRGDFREVSCTPNHPFLCIPAELIRTTKQDWWKRGERPTMKSWEKKNAEPGFRKLTVQRARALLAVAKWVPADQVQPGDLLVQVLDSTVVRPGVVELPKTRHGGRRRDRKAFTGLNSCLARLVGLYLAEGCTDENSVLFTFHAKETEYIEFVAVAMAAVFDSAGTVTIRPGTRCAIIRFKTRQGVRFFNQFGRGAKNKRIPLAWKQLGERLTSSLLGGLLEGDGSVGRDGPLFSTVSYHLAADVFDLMARLGAMPSIDEEKQQTRLPNGKSCYCHSFRVTAFGHGRERVGRLLNAAYTRPTQAIAGINLLGAGNSKYKANVLLRRVACIGSRDFDGEVFNLTVSGDASYSTPVGIAHNCGGMSVLLAKPPCVMETANDLHGDLTNLAKVVQVEDLAVRLFDRLARSLMSETLFKEAAERYHQRGYGIDGEPDLEAAYDYCLCAWLGRNGVAGTSSYNQGFCVRYTANGGHAAKRFQSVMESIPAWYRRLRNVTILCRDAFELLPRIEDCEGTVLYVDPPYLVKGAKYVHDFADEDHERLARLLHRFQKARVILSYYDHPKLAELYPDWTQHKIEVSKALAHQGARGQNDTKAVEVLLVNERDSESQRGLFGEKP